MIITLNAPVCKCGVQGDIIIDMEDGEINHVWCKICGHRLTDETKQENKESE